MPKFVNHLEETRARKLSLRELVLSWKGVTSVTRPKELKSDGGTIDLFGCVAF